MKRILSLVLVLVLLMSSALLVACDDKTDEPAATTAATTTPETEGDSGNGGGGNKPAADPVEVDRVNGKNAAELFEAAMDELLFSETYEMEAKQTFFDADADEYDVNYKIKLGDERVYVYMDKDNYVTEYWVIDNVMYGISDEGKTKVEVESLSHCFVMDIVGDMMEDFFAYIEKDVYLAELADVKLYYYNAEYYYERALTEDEADSFDLDVATAKETVYFNVQGDLIKRVFKDSATEITIDIKSYGKPVTVNPPADPDSFVEVDLGGGGGGDVASDYALYATVFNFIDNSDTYSLQVMIDGEPQLEYAVDADGDEALCAYAEGMISDMWHVGDQLYVRQNGGDIYSAPADEDNLSAIASVRMQKQVVSALRLEEEQITSMSIEEVEDGHCITVVEDAGDGMVYYYSITFTEDFSKIAIDMAYLHNGENVMVMSYRLGEIGNSAFNIVAPI